MVNERCCRCLTITSRDTYHLRIGIASSKLNLTDNMYALGDNLLYHRSLIGDSRTLDDFVGIKDFFLRMLSFLPLDVAVIEHLLILILYLRHVGNKHVEAFFLGKHSGSSATLACSQYHYSTHISIILSSMLLLSMLQV